jgi:sortase A
MHVLQGQAQLRLGIGSHAAGCRSRPASGCRAAHSAAEKSSTPEDHAAGNYWADRFGNPEHRIDKIGVLTDVRPAG